MLTSKQRAYLRSLAMSEETIIIIGKGGITENVVIQVRDALKARELVKGKVLENSLLSAKEACEVLLTTGDGQLCDVIIDRAALDAILLAGEQADAEIIRDYAESTVAVANIKIAARSAATGKSIDFMHRALAPCRSLDCTALANAAANGIGSLCGYLEESGYGEAGEALRESPSAFERWCDDRIIETIQPQLYNAFSVGPLVAYVLARENEIKTVRIILSGKLNDLPEASIRERVRKMYV